MTQRKCVTRRRRRHEILDRALDGAGVAFGSSHHKVST